MSANRSRKQPREIATEVAYSTVPLDFDAWARRLVEAAIDLDRADQAELAGQLEHAKTAGPLKLVPSTSTAA